MQPTPEVRQKLVTVIGNLICRCIEEACKIPYILEQEQVVEMIVDNPTFFAELVRDEHQDRTGFANDRLTAKIDAAAELGQFDALDAFDMSFSGLIATDADLEPVLELVNQLTRIFPVYTGNTVTIFEKEFQLFMEKLRQSLARSGMALKAVDLTAEDMAELERKAEGYLVAGRFLQAFLFDRLLHAEVITKELVRLPCPVYTLTRQFLRSALGDEEMRQPLVKFILRACYVSQGGWQDLFDMLVELSQCEPHLCPRALLTDKIQQDVVFCCNLLCESFANLRKWTAAERCAAIEKRIGDWKKIRPALQGL
jgi:hypothetical protein